MICDTVEPLHIPFFYTLGASLGHISRTSYEEEVSAIEHSLLHANAEASLNYVRQLFTPPFALRSSRSAAERYAETIQSYGVAIQKLRSNEDPAPTKSELYQLRINMIGAATRLQTVLDAEWGTEAAFFVPQQGIYQTAELIYRADLALPEETRVRVSAEVLSEVREAGKCLAFGVPTASGFHTMRALESMIYAYSATVTVEGQTPPGPSQNWGAYTSYLHKSPERDVMEVLALLQQMKDNHRNLIMHPERVLSPNDAYRLFQEGLAAIVTMADRLAPIKE